MPLAVSGTNGSRLSRRRQTLGTWGLQNHHAYQHCGARLRFQIDRDSQLYKDIYKQRTATERINSQAVELGIERPRLRNGQAIANQNTLIYILINLRALQRLHQRKSGRASQ